MKKFLALALALVMALALAAPAMAFTDKSVADVPYELSVELVEFENDQLFGIVGAAPSDRGYAKNEIVAFIVSFLVPKGETNGDYTFLRVSGENVSFAVNAIETLECTKDQHNLKLNADGTKLNANIVDVKGKVTLQWLAFAKVTGDDASITAEVYTKGDAKAAQWDKDEDSFDFEIDEEAYEVTLDDRNEKVNIYTVSKGKGRNQKPIFAIETNKKGESQKLFVFEFGFGPWGPRSMAFEVIKNNKGAYVFVGEDGTLLNDAKNAQYKNMIEIIEEEFEGVFGFDYDLIGGVVNKATFDDMVSYDALSYTVDIAPWTAYVQVPDIIVVDPPKTGDATVLVGIVMAIVAAAGVVVFNKVRA